MNKTQRSKGGASKAFAIFLAVIFAFNLSGFGVFAAPEDMAPTGIPISPFADQTAGDWDELRAHVEGATGTVTIAILNDINSADSIYTGVIEVPSGANITIDGGGFTLIQATLNQRHFNVKGELTLVDVTLQGVGPGYHHGGVEVSAAGALTLGSGSLITNNAAVVGGGVLVNGGTLNMVGGAISGNATTTASDAGGGVAMINSAVMTMSSGEISGNISLNGGGVDINSGTFTMTGGEIMGNDAHNGGGGVRVNIGAFFIMEDGLIEGNTAGGAYGGGGVQVFGGTFTMTGGTIYDNHAFDSAASYAGIGGGVAVHNQGVRHSGTFTMLDQAEIIGNTAESGGGGVAITYYAAFNMENGTIAGNAAPEGGGVHVSQGDFAMADGMIENNNADHGAGVAMFYEAVFTMAGGAITGNTATGDGGGVWIWAAEFTMNDDAEVTGNQAQNGGGVFLYSGYYEYRGVLYFADALFTLAGGMVEGNTAAENGGGVYVNIDNQFVLIGGAVADNNAGNSGGGVYVSTGGEFDMLTGTVTGNTAGYDGGGVWLDAGINFTMESGSISGNAAGVMGGGIHFEDGNFVMEAGEITDNTAMESGGGVSMLDGVFTMENGLISRNTAGKYGETPTARGGGVFIGDRDISPYDTTGDWWDGEDWPWRVRDAWFTMQGGTISHNTAYGDHWHTSTVAGGGGIFMQNATLTLEGGEIESNRAEGAGGGVNVSWGNVNMASGNITKNTAGTEGAGAYVRFGDFIMEHGLVDSNEVTGRRADGDGGGGGGVHVSLGNFSMEGGFISNNTAYTWGGGVYVFGQPKAPVYVGGDYVLQPDWMFGGTALMTGGVISYNAAGADSVGGGVYVNMGTFTMEDGYITDNKSGTGGGGGVFVLGQPNYFYWYMDMPNLFVGAITLYGGTISDNVTTGPGGGVLAFGAPFAMYEGSLITGNRAGLAGGGGVFLRGDYQERWIYVDGYREYLQVFDLFGGEHDIFGGAILDNVAEGPGGGIQVFAANLTVHSGDIAGNTAGLHGGGGVFVHPASTQWEVHDGTWEWVDDGDYGMYVFDPHPWINDAGYWDDDLEEWIEGLGWMRFDQWLLTQLDDIVIDPADRIGGTLTLSGGVIEENTLVPDLPGGGAGVRIHNGAFTMAGGAGIASNNANNRNGGGLFVSAGDAVINAGTITDNQGGNGGGVYVTAGATANIQGGSITNNAATLGNGGGIFTEIFTYQYPELPEAGSPHFSNLTVDARVTFGGNSAANGGFWPPVNGAAATNIAVTAGISGGYPHSLNNLDINFLTGFYVTFAPGSHGSLAGGAPNVQIFVPGGTALAAAHIPAVAPDSGWAHAGWLPHAPLGHVVTADITFTADYEAISPTMHAVIFAPGENGTLTGGTPHVSIDVAHGTALTAAHIPEVNANNGWTHVGWEITAQSPAALRITAFIALRDLTNPLGHMVTAPVMFTAVYEPTEEPPEEPEETPRPPVIAPPPGTPVEPPQRRPYIPWAPREAGQGGAGEVIDGATDDTPDDTPPPIPINPMPIAHTHYAYMIGYAEDGTIRPHANITRAEVSTIFFRLTTDGHRANIWTQVSRFADVTLQHWFNNPVSTMAKGGLFAGLPLGENFYPNQATTRAEFAVMTVNYLGLGHYQNVQTGAFADTAGHWANDAIYVAYRMGWVQGFGDGTFRPDQPITRAEVAALINRALGRLPQGAEDLLPGMVTWQDNMDQSAWYYLHIQEATNSHEHVLNPDGIHETWVRIIPPRDWRRLEMPDATPHDLVLR